MNKIEIFNETNEDLDIIVKDIKNVLKIGLKHEFIKNAEFNIIFVDEDTIHNLNRDYRNVDRVTDVISFALEDQEDSFKLNERLLGDIYICVKRAHEQAIEYGHSFKREMCFLSIHGLFHLLGYDHMNSHDEKIMFGKQEEVLKEYGVIR